VALCRTLTFTSGEDSLTRESLIASSDKAQRILHWKLSCSLEDIVSTAWNWHQYMLGTALY